MADYETIQKKFKYSSQILSAISDKIRQRIIIILVKNKERGLNVTEIAKEARISRPAISHHLFILKKAGLVEIRKEGTKNFYVLKVEERLRELNSFIGELINIVVSFNN